MLLWFKHGLKILRLTNNSLKTDIWFSFIKSIWNCAKQAAKFRPDDVIIGFVRDDQGLYYLEGYVPEETSVLAMVAQRMIKLSNTELVHIQLCHLCSTLMRHLFRVAPDIPKLRGIKFYKSSQLSLLC
jgi:hypothetical protein